jgi:hypothetical protein
MKKMNCCEFGTWGCIHNTFFFVTYEWTQKARVLQNSDLESLASDKPSSLFVPVVSYVENGLM